MENLSLIAKSSVPTEAGDNSLMQIHKNFYRLCQLFKEKVCNECNWSVPTYYRKIKGGNEYVSNAERSQISQVEQQCIRDLMKNAGMLPAEASPTGV